MRDRDYLADPHGLELLPRAAEGLRALALAGLKLVVVSNQSGIARGLFPESAVGVVNRALAALLEREDVVVSGWYHCPHGPDSTCECRKPRPGMIVRAGRELGLDLPRSFAVGDRARDLEAARAAGVRGGAVLIEGRADAAEVARAAADLVAADLEVAARWILARLP